MSNISRTIALVRVSIGLPALLFPATSASLFALPLASTAPILLRMVAGRDLALGALLWASNPTTSSTSAMKSNTTTPSSGIASHGSDKWATQRMVLKMGMIADVLDVLSTGLCVWEGNLEVLPAGILAGGAAGLIGLAVWRLNGLGWK